MSAVTYAVSYFSGVEKCTAARLAAISFVLAAVATALSISNPRMSDYVVGVVLSAGIYQLARVLDSIFCFKKDVKNNTRQASRPLRAYQHSLGKDRAREEVPPGVDYLPGGSPDPRAFDVLVGMGSAVEAVKDALEMPITDPERIQEYRITPPRGILLYGPPGTGKTCFARAVARYFGCSFYAVNASSILGPYVGTGEESVRKLFDHARRHAPAVIFLDEIDAVGRRRDGGHLNRPSDILLQPLLGELDGFKGREGVFVIAATNRPDVLDEALTRPGRFDRKIEIPLPDAEAREKLFRLYLGGRPVKLSWQDMQQLVVITEGFSGADVKAVCDQAATWAAREGEKIERNALARACQLARGGGSR
ncbi:MAG: ATP-binding protein [Bacillota bacterium]